jgi:hypothetical protein
MMCVLYVCVPQREGREYVLTLYEKSPYVCVHNNLLNPSFVLCIVSSRI